MKWFFLSPALKNPPPGEPPFTALEREQREIMAQALRYLEPVMASDDLAECHHRMALAASLLRAALGRKW